MQHLLLLFLFVLERGLEILVAGWFLLIALKFITIPVMLFLKTTGRELPSKDHPYCRLLNSLPKYWLLVGCWLGVLALFCLIYWAIYKDQPHLGSFFDGKKAADILPPLPAP